MEEKTKIFEFLLHSGLLEQGAALGQEFCCALFPPLLSSDVNSGEMNETERNRENRH